VLKFILRRLAQAVPILLGVSIVVFGLIHLAPGNPLDLLLPPEASPAVIAQMKVELGFDKPLIVQYFLWLMRALHGNFGVSIFSGRPVMNELLVALSNTMVIALPAAFLGFGLGIGCGLLAAAYGGKWPDKFFSAIAITGVSVPHYWFAIVMVMIFSVYFNVLPAQGMYQTPWPESFDDLRYLILPVITLSLIPMGVVARMTRATTLDVLSQEFIGALDARGLPRKRLTLHVIRNAASPVVAIMGLQFGYLVAGSILVETVFNWPGSGYLLNLSIFRRDIPVVQGTILTLAFLFVLLNLFVDVLQAAIDPRIRR
jgi:peptide/nickel transport system permease protein